MLGRCVREGGGARPGSGHKVLVLRRSSVHHIMGRTRHTGSVEGERGAAHTNLTAVDHLLCAQLPVSAYWLSAPHEMMGAPW